MPQAAPAVPAPVPVPVPATSDAPAASASAPPPLLFKDELNLIRTELGLAPSVAREAIAEATRGGAPVIGMVCWCVDAGDASGSVCRGHPLCGNPAIRP